MEWEYEKEFDNMGKLTQYLNKIQNLNKAEIKALASGNWKLSFNVNII